MTATAGGNRYLTLDHWRAFAALWVLVYHGHRGGPALEPAWLGRFVANGWLGVFVFFVISGYCIAERAAREYRQGGTAGRFMLDRLLRIYPPYWLAFLVTLLLNVAGALAKGVPVTAPSVLPHDLGWLAGLSAMEPWFSQPTYVLVAWTLTYEVGFYLVAAALLAVALHRRRPVAGFAAGAVLFAAGLVPAVAGWFPLLVLWPHFALGGLVWLVWQMKASTAGRLALGTGLIGTVWLGSWLQPAESGLPLRAACVFAWLVLVLRPWDAPLAGFGPLRWLGWIGTFSYSLYLVHAPIVGKTGNLIGRWPPAHDHPLLLLVFACLLTLPCAWLFYRRFELASETFRHAFMRRHFLPRS